MDEIMFMQGDSMVCLEGDEKVINVCNTPVFYREGVWMEQDEDGEFYADWGLTWFYTDRTKPEDYLYFEQGCPESAIHNLLRAALTASEKAAAVA